MKHLNLLKSTLLLCALIVGSTSVWANPGDEIKSPGDVVSGKWYYIKGVTTISSVETIMYYGPTEVDTKNTKVKSNAVTDISNAMPVKFTAVSGGWTIETPNGNYIRPHSSNGESYFQESAISLTLESGKTKEGTGKGIKIGKYTASGKDWYLQANNSALKIGGYKNTQYDVTLVEAYTPATFAVGKTMISISRTIGALDLAHMPSGLKAYKVSSANASSVTLTEVTEAVAKNTGLILTGTAGETYNIPVIGSGTDISASNLLVAANGTDNVTSAYVLSDGKFHPVAAAGVVIPAGKAYLPAGSLSAHELDITFDNGDVTGIEAVETQKAFDGAFYNLNGQRVAQPAKGLYIVNGKKVVIK